MVGKQGTYLIVLLGFLLMPASCKQKGSGCTDPLANNTNPAASQNDGSCTYDPVWMPVDTSLGLDPLVAGSSGLISWDGLLWTHNDHVDTRLFGMDAATGVIQKEYTLPGVTNTDWEDIAEDGEYIYVGDFGNNASGNRSDLHILRIEMNSLKSGDPVIDTLWFSYEDQTDLNPAASNQTDFDCEAMVVTSGSICLFTKQWVSGKTGLYTLSKQPGTHVAWKEAEFNVQGLVTGATLLESEQLLVLCGYTGILQPFLYLFYDYPGQAFFSGNKRRVNISIPLLQVEGVTSDDGLIYYFTNEEFVLEPATNNPQQLHRIDLSELLKGYLNGSGI